ncbi:hypothetical protein ES702_04253 [subsurface metagenome]
MSCPTFPSDPDALCETLNPPEGYWAYGELDSVFAKYGTYSIRSTDGPEMGYGGLTHFEFSPYPNIKAIAKRLFFWCALDVGLEDRVHISLQDQNQRGIRRWIHVPPIKVWQPIDISLFEGWSGDVSLFDWENVKSVRVTCLSQTHWVDILHFYTPGVSYSTYIKSVENSTDVPRTMYISGPDLPRTKFTTPITFNLLQCDNDEYTIEASLTRFLKWEDGSTSPVRKYIPATDAALIAYYSKFVMSTLKIDSVPQGKTFTIEGVSGVTPSTYSLDPNTLYTVSVDPTNFKQWEDGSTNPTRIITLATGENKTITAYYDGAPPPPDGDWRIVLILGVATLAGVVGIVLFRRR